MIVWLASYPKSGNTLLRSILSSYFFSKDGIFDFSLLKNIPNFPEIEFFKNLHIDVSNEHEINKNYIAAQNLINNGKKNKIIFLKTHSSFCKINNYNFTDNKNTLGCIYVVRDPRNVAISRANHFYQNYEEATEDLFRELGLINNNYPAVKTYVGTWSFNFKSWKRMPKKNFLLIKYEDLILNKEIIINKIFKFLENLTTSPINIDQKKIKNILQSTDFHYLQKMEKEKGFEEASKKKGKTNPFFHLGPENNWKNILSLKLKEKIENKLFSEMKELEYL